MLRITIPGREVFDDAKSEFITTHEKTLDLEHSLLSVSRWESKWRKPFLSNDEKTIEETIDYVRCMTITPNVDPKVYYSITNENIYDINQYIADPMTATTIRDEKNGSNKRIITSEVIYSWMIQLDIPFSCEKWHLNRLLTLIRVCNAEQNPPQKMSKSELAARNRALNAQRRARLNSKG